MSGLQRVLQMLLSERISIRDLPAILEGVAEAAGNNRNPPWQSEQVRARLARQLCNVNMAPGGYLPILPMSPQWEQSFAEAMIGDGEARQLAMAPSKFQEFVTTLQERFESAAKLGEVPVLLTSPGIRPHVRSIVERFRTQTVVRSRLLLGNGISRISSTSIGSFENGSACHHLSLCQRVSAPVPVHHRIKLALLNTGLASSGAARSLHG